MPGKVTAQSTIYTKHPKPQLVVGLVIDQMRYDYLVRFAEKYGQGGFKRLVNEGFLCKNTHYNYVPTETGPGHASIYTGTTPAIHGIIANDRYDRRTDRNIYCVFDSLTEGVGTSAPEGQKSPHQLLSTTITDQLRLASAFKSKVVSVSVKDRSAILPGGHTANGAYWYETSTGRFISSDYYMKKLPEWVEKYNNKKISDRYISQVWTPLLPISSYTESTEDDNPFEVIVKGKVKPTFPYNLQEISKIYAKENNTYWIVPRTPFGNSMIVDFAEQAVTGEKLGKSGQTDFLAVSFSTPDLVGHLFGPRSVEVEDTYLRLDKDIEALLNFLDREVGKEQYLVFLTADHGGTDIPDYLNSIKMPGGYAGYEACKQSLNQMLQEKYGSGKWVLSFEYNFIYLNTDLINAKKLDTEGVRKVVAEFVMGCDGVADVYTSDNLHEEEFTKSTAAMVQAGYNRKRSGDLTIVLQPGWLTVKEVNPATRKGTSHGSTYRYDTHVPLIWYGTGIPKGSTSERVNITDIAPTLSTLLNIPFPDGASGEPIEDLTGD